MANSVNGGRIVASLALNIKGETTTLEVVKRVVDGSVFYVLFVDSGTLPSGDDKLEFSEVNDALIEFAKQAKLVVEIADDYVAEFC